MSFNITQNIIFDILLKFCANEKIKIKSLKYFNDVQFFSLKKFNLI
jgi:hypothetical protein